MPLDVTLFLLGSVLATATLSGVFGMAGGIVLMGVFTALMPIQAAMATHSAAQLIANGWRAILHRRHVNWRVVGIYSLGAAGAAGLLALFHFAPSKAWVYLLLGCIPLLSWAPQTWLQLDISRPPQAIAAGFTVTGFNLMAGGAGPLLDAFYVRTALTRHQIVATKATTQTFSHVARIVFYGAPLLARPHDAGAPPAWFFIAMIPLAMAGGWIGGAILDRLSDHSFKTLLRLLLTAIAIVYLAVAASLFMAGAGALG